MVWPESKISNEHFCEFFFSLFGANRKSIYGFPSPSSQKVGRDEREREMRGREGREIRGFRGGKDGESTDVLQGYLRD